MAQVPDFKNVPDEEFKDTLSRVLKDLNTDANRFIRPVIGSNVVFQWIDDGVTPLPDGYVLADGKSNGSFDVSKSKIILIQKVK